MNCSKIMEMVYDSLNENSVPLLNQIQIWFHSLYCPECAQQIERFEVSLDIMREDFFPPSPHMEDSIMAMITEEPLQAEEPVPGGLSTRSWVIAGLIILISLATTFYGLDFHELAVESGMSILLPVGITIGCVLTIYGALFIGSHLKELTEKFGI